MSEREINSKADSEEAMQQEIAQLPDAIRRMVDPFCSKSAGYPVLVFNIRARSGMETSPEIYVTIDAKLLQQASNVEEFIVAELRVYVEGIVQELVRAAANG